MRLTFILYLILSASTGYAIVNRIAKITNQYYTVGFANQYNALPLRYSAETQAMPN